MKILHVKFQAILTNIVASYMFFRQILKHFLFKLTPQILDFISQILKNNDSSWNLTGNQESAT